MAELDMLKEADNTAQLRSNFAGSELLYVPRVHWQLCRSNVLVLERIYGVPISDIDELKSRGTNMRLLAERGVETFFTQVFVHNFFHADMHPGNIFVDVTDPARLGEGAPQRMLAMCYQIRFFARCSTASSYNFV